MILGPNRRLWDLIFGCFEGPVLPYRPPGHALLQGAGIHDFGAPPGSEVTRSGGGKRLGLEP